MIRQIVEPASRDAATQKGAASVGEFAEMEEPCQLIVLYARCWVPNGDGRAEVWQDATKRFGPAKAHLVVAALDTFLLTIATYAKRPIQRHARMCGCVGEDEAVISEIIAGAGRHAGPLLRILCNSLIAPIGFAETVSAALQLHEVVCEVPWSKAAAPTASTVH